MRLIKDKTKPSPFIINSAQGKEKKLETKARLAKLKRTSPVLLLLGVLILGAAGAAILYWQSASISHVYQFTIEGLTGATIQMAPSEGATQFISNYKSKVVATTLGEGGYSTGSIDNLKRCFVVSYIDGNVPLTQGLVVSLDVTITGGGSETVEWSATGRYGNVYTFEGTEYFYPTKDASNVNLPTMDFDEFGELLIPNGQIELVTYDDVLQEGNLITGGNNLIITFSFSGGGPNGLPWGTHDADIDIVCSIGTPA